MTSLIIIVFVIILVVGFFSLRQIYDSEINNQIYSLKYRKNFLEVSNVYFGVSSSGANEEFNVKYVWLIKNSEKMQELLGNSGIVDFVAPYNKEYKRFGGCICCYGFEALRDETGNLVQQ